MYTFVNILYSVNKDWIELNWIPYFVLKEEIITFKFCQFELRLVNENNADKSAFARVGSKGIDVNESKRLSPNPSVSNLSLRPGR